MDLSGYFSDQLLDKKIEEQKVKAFKDKRELKAELKKIDTRSRKGVKYDKKQDQQIAALEEKVSELVLFQKAFMEYMHDDLSFDTIKFIDILTKLAEKENEKDLTNGSN